MFGWIGEWLLCSAWVFLGDPVAGEIRVLAPGGARPSRVASGIEELRAMAVDREGGLWFAHGASGDRLSRVRAPRRGAALDLGTAPVRALAAGREASCVVWLEDHLLVRVRFACGALLLEERAAWDALTAVASDARGRLLLARAGGEILLLEEERIAPSSARRIALLEGDVEYASWDGERASWLVLESGPRGALLLLDERGQERLRLRAPFAGRATAATASRIWIASSDENFVASIEPEAASPIWRPEEVPAGDLRAIYARAHRVIAVGSTRWCWRMRDTWLAHAGGPGLLSAAAPR